MRGEVGRPPCLPEENHIEKGASTVLEEEIEGDKSDVEIVEGEECEPPVIFSTGECGDPPNIPMPI